MAHREKWPARGALMGLRLALAGGLALVLALSLGGVGEAVACVGTASAVASQQDAPGVSRAATPGSPERQALYSHPAHAVSSGDDVCSGPAPSLPSVESPAASHLLVIAPRIGMTWPQSWPQVACQTGRQQPARDPISVLCVDRR